VFTSQAYLKGTVRQTIQVLIPRPVKYECDVTARQWLFIASCYKTANFISNTRNATKTIVKIYISTRDQNNNSFDF